MVLCTGSHRSAGQQKKAAALLHNLICLSILIVIPHTVLAATTPQLAAGYAHTVALRGDGMVWAWGDNSADQLGLGASSTLSFSAVPVAVTGGLTGVVAVAAGEDHTLALKSDGTVWAWGNNTYGQLGNTVDTNLSDSTTTVIIASSAVPVQITQLSNITAIAAGTGFSMALKSDGTVWTWGRNDLGQLGNGTSMTYAGTSTNNPPTADQLATEAVPTQLASLSGITGIAAGGYHAVALGSSGTTVWTWGLDSCGQLGDGVTIPLSCLASGNRAIANAKTTPLAVSGLAGVASVAAGIYHTVARMSDGTVEAWGSNGSGQLGDGNTTDRSTPVAVSGLTGVTAVSAGNGHTVALKSDGTVSAWGANSVGQLGTGTITSSPTPVSALSGAAGIAAGEFFTVANKTAGTVMAWGDNTSGQLGNGATVSFGTATPTPGQVVSFSLTALLGDMNNDGKVSAVDSLLALQYAVGINTLGLSSTDALARGDMNGSGTITAADALLILRKAVGL